MGPRMGCAAVLTVRHTSFSTEYMSTTCWLSPTALFWFCVVCIEHCVASLYLCAEVFKFCPMCIEFEDQTYTELVELCPKHTAIQHASGQSNLSHAHQVGRSNMYQVLRVLSNMGHASWYLESSLLTSMSLDDDT